MGPGLQLNVLLTNVPFGEETKAFLDVLILAYRRLSLLALTIIIHDLNTAPTNNNRTSPPTATDVAVRHAMHQLGLNDLTAGLTGTSSYYPHQAGNHPSRIDTCYEDPTTVRADEATYGDLPPGGTGHLPLYMDLIIGNQNHPQPPCPTPPCRPRCGSQPRTTKAPGTAITGPYMPSCAALMHQHSPSPCARQHKRAARNATLAAREHHRTSHSNSSSMTFGPQKRNSPTYNTSAHWKPQEGDAHVREALTTRRH